MNILFKFKQTNNKVRLLLLFNAKKCSSKLNDLISYNNNNTKLGIKHKVIN
jgi:hypothetical protein